MFFLPCAQQILKSLDCGWHVCASTYNPPPFLLAIPHQSDPAASKLWASLGYTRVLGAGPSGWYQVRWNRCVRVCAGIGHIDSCTDGALSAHSEQEMMFEAAAQAGKRLAFHAKWLRRPEEDEPTPGGY